MKNKTVSFFEKNYKIIMWFVIVAVVCAIIFFCIKPFKSETGFLRVNVADGGSCEPISGAVIVIPETGDMYHTDEMGNTPIMELPVLHDAHYSKLLEQNYGLITILIYCEGYKPYSLFYVHVEPNGVRDVINVWLEDIAFSVTEAPDNDWVDKLTEMFQP